jgi:hypothetical protein
MAMYSTAQQTANLKALGFRGTLKTMILNFQRGWNLGAWLTTDGLYGPKTDSALKTSMANKAARRGTCSANFSFIEFQCKCGGKYSGCQGVWVNRVHVKRMQLLRSKIGPISINRAAVWHNKAVAARRPASTCSGWRATPRHPDHGADQVVRPVRRDGPAGPARAACDSRDVGGHNTMNGRPRPRRRGSTPRRPCRAAADRTTSDLLVLMIAFISLSVPSAGGALPLAWCCTRRRSTPGTAVFADVQMLRRCWPGSLPRTESVTARVTCGWRRAA